MFNNWHLITLIIGKCNCLFLFFTSFYWVPHFLISLYCLLFLCFSSLKCFSPFPFNFFPHWKQSPTWTKIVHEFFCLRVNGLPGILSLLKTLCLFPTNKGAISLFQGYVISAWLFVAWYKDTWGNILLSFLNLNYINLILSYILFSFRPQELHGGGACILLTHEQNKTGKA